MSDLLHVDLFAGRGGWQTATDPDPEWTTIGLDIRPMAGVDVVGDVQHLPIDAKPDLLTMSPPCTEFARWMMPWLDEPEPDMSLVNAALDAVETLQPQFWVLENSRGLHQYWKPARTHVGPFYLWGEFPPMDVDASDIKGKMQTSGESPERRAEIPPVLSKAMKKGVETFGKTVA